MADPRGPARFAVRVKPSARRAAVGGRWEGRLGPALVVAVTAPAVDGKANAAVVAALATALRVPARSVVVAAGMRARDKMIEIADAPADLPGRVAELIESP